MLAFRVLIFALVSIQLASANPLAEEEPKIVMPSTWEEFTLHHRTMENLFTAYKKAFHKTFTTPEEEKTHLNQFITRVKTIFDWNDPQNKSQQVVRRTYWKGINKFTDLSDEERKNYVMPETKVEVPPISVSLFLLFPIYFVV